jgi:hypothetical protein
MVANRASGDGQDFDCLGMFAAESDFVSISGHGRGPISSKFIGTTWGRQSSRLPPLTKYACPFTSEPVIPMAKLIDLFPEISRRLKGAQPTSSVRGSISGSSNMRSVVRDGVALIGDASGSVDALTGEGLSMGFQQALALAEAFAKDDLSHYEAAHHRIGRMPLRMTNLMLFVGARGWLRRRVLHALAAESPMFGVMLGAHVGAWSPATIRPRVLASFVRNLLALNPLENRKFV